MGGAKRDDPKEARTHFEIASCEECDSQARAPPTERPRPGRGTVPRSTYSHAFAI